MTQEEKAKAYDEAIESMRDWITYVPIDEVAKNYILETFPELKQSEDERIRKALIHLISEQDGFLTAINGISVKDILAWLEKQGDNADKVEPKFKIGDWVIDKQGIVHQIANVIENVTNHTYGYDIVGGGYFNDNTEGVRLWTIQDAKDGDVLIDKSNYRECPFIFKETKPSHIKTDVLNPLTILGYCGIGGAGFTKGIGWGDTANCTYYPATKEQRELLFQKMKEAGYEWDSEKKELKKIEGNLF